MTRSSTINPVCWVFHGSLEVRQGTVQGCAWEQDCEQRVMQCVREHQRELGKEQSTNSRPEETMLFQF